MVVTTDYQLWLGNELDEVLKVDPFPIFGFGLGDFEDKVVAGPTSWNCSAN